MDAERGVQLLQDSGRTARSPSMACREPFRLTQEVTAVLTVSKGTPAFHCPQTWLQVSTQYCVWASGIKRDREQRECMGVNTESFW